MKKWNCDTWIKVVLICGFIMMAAAFVFYMIFCIDYILDSDMSSELVLAQLLAGEGGILSTEWYYSTELRVLNTQLIFAPLFLFVDDWHFIRVAGTVILAGILVGSYIFLTRRAGLRRFFVFAALLLCPLSDAWFSIVLAGGFYVPHISITFVTLAFVIIIWKKSWREKRTWLYFTALCILSLAAGMGGFRQVMVLYIPLFATAVVFAIWNYKKDLSYKKLLAVTAGALLCGMAGCLINIAVLSRIYTFKSWKLELTGFSFSRMEININGWLTDFGLKTGELFSIENLAYNAAFAIIFLLTAFAVYYIIKNKERYEKEQVFLTLFFVAGIVTMSVFYLFVDMYGQAQYLLPVSVLFIPVLASFLQGISDRRIAGGIELLLLLVCVGVSALYYQEHSETDSSEYMEIEKVLTTENVTEGYASFWNANVLTELSDGGIEVWTCGELQNGGLNLTAVDGWLQKKEHLLTQPEGRVFLLLTAQECSGLEFSDKRYDSYIVYQSEEFVVYIFERYDEMMDIYMKGAGKSMD